MGAPLRLLFISNDPTVLEGVAAALRSSFPGLEATGVHDVRALAGALAEGAFDVAITDYQLDWTDGSAVVQTLKERWPELPVVLFSVSGADELQADVAAMRRAGPGAELPQSVALLAGTIRSALERSEHVRERRRAEAALRESEARFRSVFESATDAIVLADSEGRILSWNRGAQAMFGYAADEVVGRPLAVLMPERYRRAHAEGLARFRATGERRVTGNTVELSGLRKDGGEFPIELAIGAWETGNGPNFSGVIRDITERRRAEEELRRSYEQLRELSARVARIQEQERTAIAREIHDELGQALTALRMDAAWIKKRMDPDRADHGPLFDRLEDMEDAIDATIVRVRQISAELRPPLLDQLGLAAALEWQAQEFQERTGIRCRVRAPAGARLSRDATTNLFRIFQECLTNVARHSGAHSAEASLRRARGSWVLEVRDDGSGISEDAAQSPTSLGLRGIQERASLLGGTATIRGGRDGTQILVSLPRAAGASSGKRTGAVA